VIVDHPNRRWKGPVGPVTKLIDRIGLHARRTCAFVCGSQAMMAAAAGELVRRGVPPCRVQLSLERSMTCGVGWCGECRFGPLFACLDGAVVSYDRVAGLLAVRER
jgi:NAD(P)H-flavin reductase